MIIKEVMSRNIVKVPSTITIAEAARLMDKKDIGSVLISEDNEVVGIMTERDILRKAVAAGKKCEEAIVKDIMTSSLITIDAEDSLEKANEVMSKHKIRRLIVTENDNIVGIITIRDVAENLRYSSAKRLAGIVGSDYGRGSYEKQKY